MLTKSSACNGLTVFLKRLQEAYNHMVNIKKPDNIKFEGRIKHFSRGKQLIFFLRISMFERNKIDCFPRDHSVWYIAGNFDAVIH